MRRGWNPISDTWSSPYHSLKLLRDSRCQAPAQWAARTCTQRDSPCTATEIQDFNLTWDKEPRPSLLILQGNKKQLSTKGESFGSRGFQTNWQAINNLRPDDLCIWKIAQGKRNYRENLCHLMCFALDVVFETHMESCIILCKTLSRQSSSAESCNLKLFFFFF